MRHDQTPFEHPWDQDLLGNIADVIVGGTPSTTNPFFWNGLIPWMASGDIHRQQIHDVDGRITKLGLRSSAAVLVSPPAVAMALAGQGKTRGTVALTQIEVCTNQSVALIKPEGSRLNAEFLYQSLVPRYGEMRSRSAGGGRAGLTKTILEQIPIQLPMPEEQEKIARILTTLDSLIQKTETLIAKYQAIKQGMMHDLFTRGVDKHGQLRPPQHKAVDLYKQSELGWMPKEWKTEVITTCCSEVFLGLTSKVDYVGEDGVPLVRATDISGGMLSFENALCISNRQHKELTKYRRAKRGDVLISKSGSLGVCAIVETDTEFSIYESIIVLQPVKEMLNSQYLLSLMRHSETQRRLLGETVGSTVGHLNLNDFKRLRVPIPPLPEQRAISASINSLHETIEATKSDLGKNQQLKSGLMQDLLTGKVRVKVDEAEEVAAHA